MLTSNPFIFSATNLYCHYFEKAWKRHWGVVDKDDIPFWESFCPGIRKIIERFKLKIV